MLEEEGRREPYPYLQKAIELRVEPEREGPRPSYLGLMIGPGRDLKRLKEAGGVRWRRVLWSGGLSNSKPGAR